MVSLPGVTFSRREGAIIARFRDDLGVAREAELQLPVLVAAVARGDTPSCLAARDRIFELEDKADAVHRELSTQIAQGAFFGGVREDMLDLLEKIDNIADKAKDSAQLITLAEVSDPKAKVVLASEDMKEFLANLDAAVVALSKTIEAFEKDRKAILELVHEVEKFEEAADDSKHKMLKTLFDPSSGRMDPVTLILVMDFLFSADDVADNAEDASDVVTVLVAKGYG